MGSSRSYPSRTGRFRRHAHKHTHIHTHTHTHTHTYTHAHTHTHKHTHTNTNTHTHTHTHTHRGTVCRRYEARSWCRTVRCRTRRASWSCCTDTFGSCPDTLQNNVVICENTSPASLSQTKKVSTTEFGEQFPSCSQWLQHHCALNTKNKIVIPHWVSRTPTDLRFPVLPC